MYAPVGQSVCGDGYTVWTCQPGVYWIDTLVPCQETYCSTSVAVFGRNLDKIPNGGVICDKNNQTWYCTDQSTWMFLGATCNNQATCGGGLDIHNYGLENFPQGYYICGDNSNFWYCNYNGAWYNVYNSASSCVATYCEPSHAGKLEVNQPVPSGRIVCGTDKQTYFCDYDTKWRNLNIPCTPTFCAGEERKDGTFQSKVAAGKTICESDGTTYYCDMSGNYIHTNFPCTA